tara:strand:+ start:107 stop:376 length:270 start_codon:yes stop_codon:yes gene_type:complete
MDYTAAQKSNFKLADEILLLEWELEVTQLALSIEDARECADTDFPNKDFNDYEWVKCFLYAVFSYTGENHQDDKEVVDFYNTYAPRELS